MAKLKDDWQIVTLKPITASLDARSAPGDVALGSHRMIQNLMLSGTERLCRRPQYQKLLSSLRYDLLHAPTDPLYNPVYTNPDFHDQSNAAHVNPRQAPTLIFEAIQNANGLRFLYVATQNNIFLLNETTGTWTQITAPNTYGGPPVTPATAVSQTRFQAAELQDVLLFANNVDAPLYTNVNTNSVATVPDLQNYGGADAAPGGAVQGAFVVVSFSGFLFLMNIQQGAQRFSSRILWCDLNAPLTWIPVLAGQNANLAGWQDLDYGHDILGALPMQGSLYIYTSKSIWRAFIGQNVAWGFVKIYEEPANGSRCLFFPNTLISAGDEHYFASLDGWYRFNPYIVAPERDEWLYKGTAAMFSDTGFLGDIASCQSVIACSFQEDQEVMVSWPEANAGPAGQNTKSLAFNYAYKAVSIIDTGYASFGTFNPNPATGAQCGSRPLLVGAAAADWCLKSISTIYSRETCANAATAAGTGQVVNGIYVPFAGQYVFLGYYSILRGLFPFQNLDREKEIKHLLVEPHPDPQAVPCVCQFRVGISYSEADPNLPDGPCSILWHPLKSLPLVCPDTLPASKQVAANRRRGVGPLEWELLWRGRFVFYELTVANADGSPAIGGSCCFSRMEAVVRVLPR